MKLADDTNTCFMSVTMHFAWRQALLVASLLKVRTGYNWPWEGPAEWAEPQRNTMKAAWRNLVLWLVIVLLLLAFFTLWQFPGFR